ncbi:MAG: copper resistance protein [Gammaproteobacteria bacterium HGW-Gammaproteobacteria-10]|nr:MAG: copper resistance protein [Gammaproteobacteria bacterium HGW-Gammaproteobacteria-10]
MGGLADFLDSLVGGVDRVFFSAAIGGLIWGLFMLKPWHGRYNDKHLSSTVSLIYYGACGLAFTQGFALILKVWLMYATLGIWPFPAFADTIQFKAGLARMIVIGCLAYYVGRSLSLHPASKNAWYIAAAIAIPALLAGAWLAHGAGRFDARIQLMTMTVIHQIGAAAWVGGVFQLLNIWRLQRRNSIDPMLWPNFLRRFKKLGLVSLCILLVTGLPMAIGYIDSWNGFIGTGYGNLLMVKLLLLGTALFLAYLNNRGTREFFEQNSKTLLYREIPSYIQAEAFVLISILFTAVSLATQPPAIDIPETTATWQETLATFKPRIPLMTSPTHEELMAGEPGRTAIVGQVPSRAMTDWSDYNHNVAGVFVATIALLSIYANLRPPPPHRGPLWPLGFAFLGLFLFIRSDPEVWPLGPVGFWESTLNSGEILQHRIATLLAFIMGVLEYKARHPNNVHRKLVYMFPILGAFGGLMLLTHSHVGFQAKTAFLIQAGHTLMGVFSIIVASARWLEIQLHDPKQKQIAGLISAFAMLQVGMILMFYQEPLY